MVWNMKSIFTHIGNFIIPYPYIIPYIIPYNRSNSIWFPYIIPVFPSISRLPNPYYPLNPTKPTKSLWNPMEKSPNFHPSETFKNCTMEPLQWSVWRLPPLSRPCWTGVWRNCPIRLGPNPKIPVFHTPPESMC